MKTARKPICLRRSGYALLLLFWISSLSGCAAPPPAKPGTHLKLETITHDGQTAYSYRTVYD